MRIISEKALKQFARRHPEASSPIEHFTKILRCAAWKNIEEVREDFPHADLVKVKSGNTVCVFNVGGHQGRVVAALHFNRGNAYLLGVYTHAEYSREQWKERF